MANSKITWANKESLVTDPTIAEKNKVTDSNMNEIKSVVNENADQVIISDTEPTSTDNEIWVDTSSNATYINQEVNIGATNPSNTPTWFKQGKNLLPNNISSTTINGLTVTKNNDGTLTINGTATAMTEFYFIGETSTYSNFNSLKVGKTYCYSVCPNNDNKYKGYATIKHADTTISYNEDSGSGVNFTVQSGDVYRIFLRVVNGATLSNIVFSPMIEENSTKTTYEAYITPQIIIDNREFYSQDNYEEYSLNEIRIGTFLGKPLYRKVIDFGNMPNNTTGYVAHGISNIGLVFIKGTTNDYYQIPFRNISNGNSITTWHNTNNVFIQTNFDGSSIKATLIMEYTKTTD